MRKIWAWMLALMMLTAAAAPIRAAGAEDFEIAEGETEEKELPRIPDGAEILDHLDVGNPTPMRGEFFTNFWGNATSDIDVRELLHGYDLVVWNGDEGMFMHNPTVISEITALAQDNGDHQYLITLYNDLYYSDGTPITAWDYAFSYLLSVSPVIAELGGVPHEKVYLKGYEAYIDGTAQGLQGVRVLADNVLMLTIDGAYLPYFFELGLLDCRPYPIGEIAPGVEVRDDGNGAYLTEGMTADLLRRTVLDPDTGYMSHPRVVSGPYTLTGWDGETAYFALNSWYKGNEKGIGPVIGTLSYRTAKNEDMIDRLTDGTFGLLNKVTWAPNISRGMELMAEGEIAFSNTPRIGLSYISFAREQAAVSEEAVRQAIAWCVDRDAVMSEYTGNYGIRVDGYFGVGQWMYGVIAGTLTPEQETTEGGEPVTQEQWEALGTELTEVMTVYTADPKTASDILDRAGWKKNDQGIREKEIDGETVTLELRMIYPEGNSINEVFEKLLIPNLEEAGIRLTMEAMPMNQLLSEWYGQEERNADMIYLASNFDLLFDPASQFILREDGSHSWYYTNGTDEDLYELTLEMNRTQPGDVYGYMEKWIAFQDRFNETLPMLPFYSNIYFDFYTTNLHDYQVQENKTWSQAIVESALYIAPEEPETEEGEEESFEDDEEDGLEEFD